MNAPGRPPLRVGAAVIERGGRFLLCRRPPGKRHGGLWEFPGGKVREGESEAEALKRELFEELALRVREAGEPVFSAADPGSDFLIRFVRVVAEGEPLALEHSEIRWAEAADLRRLALAPADREFVEKGLGL